MDAKDDFAQERERRIKVERELEFWHNKAIETVSPDQLAAAIQTQQIETLTYHLLKQKQRADGLDAALRDKEAQLSAAVKNIESLEDELDERKRELAKYGAAQDAPRRDAPQAAPAGQRFNVSGIPSDEELDKLLEPETPAAEKAEQAAQKPAKQPKNIKDFIKVMRRMERLKLFDAALLMDVEQEEVLIWAKALEAKGYISWTSADKTFTATVKLLNTR
jgi:hypothetical protein